MVWLIGVFAVVLLFALVLFKAKKTGPTVEPISYLANKSLFTAAERSFLGVLDQAVAGQYRVFGKVRVADLLTVPRGANLSGFNRIRAKHFDFVLCRPDDLRPVCAIELNDQSHTRPERQARDQLLRDACQSAAFPLLYYPAQRSYVVAEVQARLREILPSPPAATVVTEDVPPVASLAASEIDAAPACPRCSSAMQKRVAKSGDLQGSEFWGCTRFPACRGMVAI